MPTMRRSRIVRRVGLLVLCALCAHRARAQQTTEDAAVKQFFPQWLIDEAVEDFKGGGPPPFQAFAYADADLEGVGRPTFIVAAYTNGFSAAVVVLAKQDSGLVQFAAPSFPLMSGVRPDVTPLDVDHDGRQEVIVGFSSAQGLEADWVLKWDGTTLKSIGPVVLGNDGNIGTLVTDGLFMDLDGDGLVEIIDPPEFDRNAGSALRPMTVYALADGKYAPSRTLNIFETFARPQKADKTSNEQDDARPDVEVATFSADPATGPFVMTIVNGDEAGAHRVRNLEIELNGIVVARSNVLAANTRVIAIPVSVKASNTLRVTLRGPRDTWLSLGIGPK